MILRHSPFLLSLTLAATCMLTACFNQASSARNPASATTLPAIAEANSVIIQIIEVNKGKWRHLGSVTALKAGGLTIHTGDQELPHQRGLAADPAFATSFNALLALGTQWLDEPPAPSIPTEKAMGEMRWRVHVNVGYKNDSLRSIRFPVDLDTATRLRSIILTPVERYIPSTPSAPAAGNDTVNASAGQ